MRDDTGSTGRDDAARNPGCSDPAARVPTALLVAEWEASDAARAAAERRHAANTANLARRLAETGAWIAGPWRYVGLVSPGLPGAVVRTSMSDRYGQPPAAAHAVCDDEVMEGDAD